MSELEALNVSCAATQLDDCVWPTKETAIGSGVAPTISADMAFGVRLESVGDANEGVVEFSAPPTNYYLISIGTPGVKLKVVTASGVVEPVCGNTLTAQLKTSITGGSCDPLRAAMLVPLRAGDKVRIELGRIAPPNQWVRLVVSENPGMGDSDLDGVPDYQDACPSDPAGSVDADGDGLCAPSDACPSDPQNDPDADGVCDGTDKLSRRSERRLARYGPRRPGRCLRILVQAHLGPRFVSRGRRCDRRR